MITYARPPRPTGFPPQKIHDAITLLTAEPSAEPPAHWSEYKREFWAAQGRKCGYCESVDVTEPGAVEHYAPKGRVDTVSAPGQEVPGTVSVKGRKLHEVHAAGYWWLAYDWDNWLFACNRCNSGWKLTVFPVVEAPHPAPDPATPYTPLLLHPLDVTANPLDHLEFDDHGQIHATSVRGRATIDACGLDRESLRDQRAKAITRAKELFEHTTVALALAAANPTIEKLAEHADRVGQTLASALGPECAYAGAVRSATSRWAATV